MRTIDADALIADLEHDVAIDQDTLDYEDLTEINRINIQFDKDCKKNAIDLLKNAPTIEPERKKGKWVRWYEEIERDTCKEFIPHCKCSECGTDINARTTLFIKFCPYCGAWMRGEEKADP